MIQKVERINPKELDNPTQYGFTNIVIVPSNRALVFIAGQGGRDPEGNLGDFAAQLKQAFTNLKIALAAAGTTPEQVVKITVLSVDHNAEKQNRISAARNKMWGDNLIKPASTLIPVSRLAGEGMLFEIDAVATVPLTS